MLSYVLICLCLALTGVAALQLMYLLYLEGIDRERKKRLKELEHEARQLRHDLADVRRKVTEQAELLDTLSAEPAEEAWADVIEER